MSSGVMMSGRYIALDDAELTGKRALIMPTENPKMVQAQFDDIKLRQDIGVGWFYLPLAAFEIYETVVIDMEGAISY